MPGDPAVVEEAKRVPAILSATDLLNIVAVKLPPFWPDNIETWLIHLESQFHLKGVWLCGSGHVSIWSLQGIRPYQSSSRRSLWTPQGPSSQDVKLLIADVRFQIEVTALLFLRCSFWGDSCGGHDVRLTFPEFQDHNKNLITGPAARTEQVSRYVRHE